MDKKTIKLNSTEVVGLVNLYTFAFDIDGKQLVVNCEITTVGELPDIQSNVNYALDSQSLEIVTDEEMKMINEYLEKNLRQITDEAMKKKLERIKWKTSSGIITG